VYLALALLALFVGQKSEVAGLPSCFFLVMLEPPKLMEFSISFSAQRLSQKSTLLANGIGMMKGKMVNWAKKSKKRAGM
jgi:hypothetical protein